MTQSYQASFFADDEFYQDMGISREISLQAQTLLFLASFQPTNLGPADSVQLSQKEKDSGLAFE